MSQQTFKSKVTPATAREALSLYDRCLYAVSVSDHGHSISTLLAAAAWARQRFKICNVLLGDSLYPMTLGIQNGPISEIENGKYDGKVDQLECDLRSKLPTDVTIIKTSDVKYDERFSIFRERIGNSFNDNLAFRESLANEAVGFVNRQADRGRLGLDRAKAIGLSLEYLIEEIAIYDLLATDGWLVDVYLGEELAPLSDIMNGSIKGVGQSLEKRVNISLRKR